MATGLNAAGRGSGTRLHPVQRSNREGLSPSRYGGDHRCT